MDYKKKKEFFVGIDSDGTIFDSMKLKHTYAFIPAAIEVWNLNDYREAFTRIEEKINLYSESRGINRFPGLYLAFEELEKEVDCKIFDGLEDFKAYLDSKCELSRAGLEEYISGHNSAFLNDLLKWSDLSDEKFNAATHGILPFDNTYDTVKSMHSSSDIMIVSAAVGEGIKKDLSNTDLINEVDFIAGQEFGKKNAQLKYAKQFGYDAEKMLMIGDAIGDYEAAKENGCLFYPMIPSKESECWKLLGEKYYEMFLNGTYKAEAEEMLCKNFFNYLRNA